MSLLIGKAIFNILSTDSTVTSFTNQNIFPLFANDETPVPFIVFERQGIETNYLKDGVSFDYCTIQVNCVAESYNESVNIAQAVRTALELKEGTFSGVKIIDSRLVDVSEDYGKDGFIQSLVFKIKTN